MQGAPEVEAQGEQGRPANDGGYRGPIVCKIVGISYRQMDYWARTGLVEPSIRPAAGSGTQRLYSFGDVVELKVIRRLLKAGVSLQRIRQAVGYLRNHLGVDLSGVTLLSDGAGVYACENQEQLVDLLGRGQGVFAIALGPVYQELEGQLAQLEEPAGEERAPASDSGGDLATTSRGGRGG
jgi:DNA-binding transcriptional MerR regulator